MTSPSAKRGEEELKKAFDEIKKLKEQLEAENIYLREEVKLKHGPKDIVGTSDPLKYVLYRIQQVARGKRRFSSLERQARARGCLLAPFTRQATAMINLSLT